MNQMSNHSIIRSALLFLLSVSLLLTPVKSDAELIDRVVAIINNDVITLSELQKEGEIIFDRITKTVPEDQRAQALEAARDKILNQLIDQRLIDQKATAKRISVSEAEIDATVERVLQRTGLTYEGLLAKIDQSGITESTYRTNLKTQIQQNKLIGADVHAKIVITEQMIRDHFDQHNRTTITGTSYYLLQMGFNWDDPQGRALSEAAQYANRIDAENRAKSIHKAVTAGADFKELAKKHSDLPSREDGGDIGEFQLDEMADFMRDAVRSLKPGEVSDIIPTPAGYQFFQLVAVGENSAVQEAAFESMKEDIKQELFDKAMQEAYTEWVKELKEEAYIQKL